jgi:hypothetical protein
VGSSSCGHVRFELGLGMGIDELETRIKVRVRCEVGSEAGGLDVVSVAK